MNTKDAVASRLLQLSKEYNMPINAMAISAGINPSTVYSMLNSKSKNPGVVSIKKICDGLGISLCDFFCPEVFEDLEQEIR